MVIAVITSYSTFKEIFTVSCFKLLLVMISNFIITHFSILCFLYSWPLLFLLYLSLSPHHPLPSPPPLRWWCRPRWAWRDMCCQSLTTCLSTITPNMADGRAALTQWKERRLTSNTVPQECVFVCVCVCMNVCECKQHGHQMVDGLILSGDSCPSIWLIQPTSTTHTEHESNIIMLFIRNNPRLRRAVVMQLNTDTNKQQMLVFDSFYCCCDMGLGLYSQYLM